jgi:hypothetical protein
MTHVNIVFSFFFFLIKNIMMGMEVGLRCGNWRTLVVASMVFFLLSWGLSHLLKQEINLGDET